MKTTFIFLFLVVLSLNLGCRKKDAIPLNVKLNLEKEYTKSSSKNDYWNKNQIEEEDLNVPTDSIVEHYYDISIEIENVGDRDIYLWMMSCSWYNNFEINNNYIYFYNPNGCDSNIPELKKIESKSNLTINGTVRRKLKFDYPNENSVYGRQVELTKVGLIIIDDIYEPSREGWLDYFVNIDDKSKYKFIWSNGINLLKDYNQN